MSKEPAVEFLELPTLFQTQITYSLWTLRTQGTGSVETGDIVEARRRWDNFHVIFLFFGGSLIFFFGADQTFFGGGPIFFLGADPIFLGVDRSFQDTKLLSFYTLNNHFLLKFS